MLAEFKTNIGNIMSLRSSFAIYPDPPYKKFI